MKNIILALSLIALCTLPSCTDDPTIEEQLIGDWTRSSFEFKDCDDPTNEIPLTAANEMGCSQVNINTLSCSTVNFIAGGKGTETSIINGNTMITDLNYTVNMDTDVLTICNPDDCFTGTINENILSFDFVNDQGCMVNISYTR